EDDFRARHFRFGGLHAGHGYEVFGVLELELLRPRGERELVWVAGDANQIERLSISAVVARGLQAVRFELRGDVLLREVISARRWSAAFEQVRREEARVRQKDCRRDGLGGVLLGGRDLNRGARRESGQAEEHGRSHARPDSMKRARFVLLNVRRSL